MFLFCSGLGANFHLACFQKVLVSTHQGLASTRSTAPAFCVTIVINVVIFAFQFTFLVSKFFGQVALVSVNCSSPLPTTSNYCSTTMRFRSTHNDRENAKSFRTEVNLSGTDDSILIHGLSQH